MFITETVFCLMFGCFGFFLSFFITRTVNIVFIMLMAWVPLKVFEKFGQNFDLKLLHRFYDLLLGLGESLIELLTNLLGLASVGALIFFVLGGVTGMVYHLHAKRLG